MVAKLPLMQKHPTLFKTVLLVGISNLTIALFCAFNSPKAAISFTRITSISIVHEPIFWTVTFLLGAIFCLHGALTSKYQMARIGLILSAAIGGFLALGFWLAYFAPGTVGISAPVSWSFYTLICIINSSEPAVNPLSAALQQNIHETLASDEHIEGANNGHA